MLKKRPRINSTIIEGAYQMSEDKKYDHKFTFAWKDGVLDFGYDQEGVNKLNKHFNFGEKPEDIYVEVKLLNEKENDFFDVSSFRDRPTVSRILSFEEEALVETVVDKPAQPEPLIEPHTTESPTFVLPVPEKVAEEPAAILPPVPMIDVVLNSNVTDEPTVQVRLPEEMPQIVSVSVEMPLLTSEISTVSVLPQALVVVEDATVKVPKDSVLHSISTPPGMADLVVAVSPEVQKAAEMAGIDVVKAVEDAVNLAEHHPELPDIAPSDKTDNVIPQVIGMSFDGTVVKLSNVSEKIPENSLLVAVETPPEMPNIVAVVDDATMASFETKGLDPAVELGKFIQDGNVEIATVKDIEPEALDYLFSEDSDAREYLRRWGRQSHGDD